MLLEMHCHTSEHSACSYVGAADLARQIYRVDLQGAVITDHHFLWTEEQLQALKIIAHVPQYFLLISGQEVSTSDVGDLLVYGATAAIERDASLAEVRAAHPLAALVLAHPYRNGRLPAPELLLNPLLDAVEIFNSNHSISENTRGLRDWHRYRFTAIAGTDTHGITYAGLYPTYFDHPVESVEELAGEIREGRCRPFFREIPRAKARARIHEVSIGKKKNGQSPDKIIIKHFFDTDLWHSAQRASLISRELQPFGFAQGRYRVPTTFDDNQEDMTLVEQSFQGCSLFDKLTTSTPEAGKLYVELAARWLAHLHNQRLQITPPSEFLIVEQERLDKYGKHFDESCRRHAARVREIIEAVRREEKALFEDRPQELVQGHGDFHLKNIFIGQDDSSNPESVYVAAIDFDSSYCLPPAFDIGTFLAQFRNQLIDYPDIIDAIPEETFLNTYISASNIVDSGLPHQVELFKARGNLSIASFLVQIGLGDSENLWRVLLEAERAITQFTAHSRGI